MGMGNRIPIEGKTAFTLVTGHRFPKVHISKKLTAQGGKNSVMNEYGGLYHAEKSFAYEH